MGGVEIEKENHPMSPRIKLLAVVHIEWDLEFRAGGETKKVHAMNTMVMTKEGGKWSIAAFQNTARSL